MNFIKNWLIHSAAFLLAIYLLPDLTPLNTDKYEIWMIAATAGLISSLITPTFKLITFPLVFFTFGLWLFLSNLILFYLAGYLGHWLGFGFIVADLNTLILGTLIVSFTTFVLKFLLG